MFKRIAPTLLAAAVSVFVASCASERDHYGFGYDCTNADARKAASDTSNTKTFTYGNGNPVTDHETGKILDHGTKLGVIKTRGTVDVPSFYNKALNGRVDEAKDEYFQHLILTKECGFPVDGKQKAWFHLDRPEEPQFDVLPRGASLLGWIASPWVSEDRPQFKGECSPR